MITGYDTERIIKIGQHLPKLQYKYKGHSLFWLTVYLQFYYISELLQQNCILGLLSRIIRPNWTWSC